MTSVDSNSIKVLISKKQYQIDEQIKNLMNYFSEVEALQKINSKQAIQLNITENIWLSILQLCKACHNKFPQIAKIKTSNSKQVIGNQLSEVLQKKSYQQLNQIYLAAQILNMEVLKKTIQAFLACKVYYKKTFQQYQKKKEQLGIQRQLTSDITNKMKETYGFMN